MNTVRVTSTLGLLCTAVFLTFLFSTHVAALPETALIVTTGTASRQAVTYSDPAANPSLQTLTAELPANASPRGIAFFGNDAALIGDSATPRIFVIQPSTGTLISTITVPSGCSSGMILVSPNLEYAITASGTTLCAIKAPFTASSTTTTLTMTGSIGSNASARTFAMMPDGRVFVRTLTGIIAINAPYTSEAFTIPRTFTISTGTISNTPDGNQLLVTQAGSVGSSILVYNAPFSESSTPQTITSNTGLSNLTISPDGQKAIFAVNTPFDHIVRVLNAPFQTGATAVTLTMPAGYGGCSEASFSADSSAAILSNCGAGAQNVLIKGPFTAVGAQTSFLPVNAPNPNSGGGLAVFMPPQFTTPSAPAKTTFDFDGDGRADTGVFRPADGIWYIDRSSAGFAAAQWGISTDKLAPADYDGDDKTDLAIWRESESNFYILNSADATVRIEEFGLPGDILTVGDWDGDGKADLSTYRAGSQSLFYYRGSNNNPGNNITFIPWGTTGDKPVSGDFDGDGHADPVIFRPSNGTWYILNSTNGQAVYQTWGLSTDTLVPADYDGDAKTDVAVYRNGLWYIKGSADGQPRYIPFGLSTDTPVPADYDGDGKADIGVYRNGVWYLQQSTAGTSYINFGLATDKPLSAESIGQ